MTVGIFVEYFQGGGWENPEEETQVSHKRGRHRAPASLLDYCCLVPSLSRTAAEGAKGGAAKKGGASMPGGWRGDGIKHVAEMEVEDAVNAAVAFAVEASVLERDV